MSELLKKYSLISDIFQVIKIAKELFPLYEVKGNLKEKAEVLLLLGRSLCLTADYEDAINFLREAIAIFQEQNDPIQSAISIKELGTVYNSMGKYDESIEYLLNANKIFEQNKEILEMTENQKQMMRYAESLESTGVNYCRLKQFDKGREYYLKVIKIYEKIDFLEGVAKVLNNLGVSYSNEDSSKTLEYYHRALDIAEKINLTTHRAIYTSNIGGVYEDIKRFDKALEYYKQAYDIAIKTKIEKYLPYFLEYIGSIYLKKGEYEKAIDFIKQSLELSQKQQVQEQVKNCYQLLSEISEKKKDYKTALEYFQLYSAVKDKILNSEMIEKIAGLQKKFEESSIKITELQRSKSLISEALTKKINMRFIGNSKQIKKVMELAMTIAGHPNTNVLIIGESGTGKEIIANIIHYASLRKEHLIVSVNCSSIPDSLVESEFFGYLKGSFTGAISDKIGYLELANKGTLFLDEIADTPVALQAKMLRVLDDKKIKKLGAKSEMQVDFRIISATNKNIDELIEKNTFRLDLLHRINTITITIPPLRERPSDIQPLLEHFVREFSETLKKPIPKINVAVIDKLKKYPFPGNVRKLKNMVEKAIIMLKTDTLEPENFENGNSLSIEEIIFEKIKLKNLLEIEKETIFRVLKETDNNHTKAAKLLGISHSTLLRKLKKL
ncbi:MAG: sigma 54-interacting transcriptional regulator [Candidatus Cloacimonadales bacterium]|nr:sigma 54-interacting transcriptional regulator [Candidatus Cloacimonadales bacterium]